MKAYLKPVPKPCAKKIYEHMENYLYRINEKEGNYEIGFFIRLKDKNGKSHLALVTSPNVLKDIKRNSLKITLDKGPKPIELGDIRYEDKIYNRAVIEIKGSSDIVYVFEIDEDIFKKENDIKMIYNEEYIYIIQYDNKDNISVSYGIINDICGKEIKYSANINKNIKDNIIISLTNNKILGILDTKSKDNNNGIFISELIDQFIYEINHISTNFSEFKNNFTSINITINIDENEVNKEIYFLDNFDNFGRKNTHNHLKELNEFNTELYINDKIQKYEKYFIPEKEGEYIIELRININLTDCSYMFSGCNNIKYIYFSNFNTSKVKNMSFMFYGCESLNSLPDISKWITSNVNNMSYMFSGCESLNSLPDISKWITSKVNNMSYMFSWCNSLNSLPDISKWNTSKVKNMSGMFDRCNYLNSLPDISKWNTSKVNNMSWMFSWCNSLNSLPDISKWNTNNVKNMSCIFYECESLNSLPDISKWNTNKVENMSWMFKICFTLNSLPDISKWNTSKVKNMSGMFEGCNSLNSLPDISKWNTSNVNDMSYMFSGCISLNSLPDISKWNIKNMSGMFEGCISSLNIPPKFVN